MVARGDGRGSPLWTTGTTAHDPKRGSFFGADRGSFFNAYLHVLRRTVGRARVRRNSPSGEQDRVRLADNLELRKIAGHWYEITLGRLPEPDYCPVARSLKQPSRPYAATSSVRIVEVVVRQLVTPAVRDVVTGKPVLSGPEIDDQEAWRRYRADNPDRCYAIGKRQLSRRELRHHHLKNEPDACSGRRISS